MPFRALSRDTQKDNYAFKTKQKKGKKSLLLHFFCYLLCIFTLLLATVFASFPI